jgi:serine/threonine protein kinase
MFLITDGGSYEVDIDEKIGKIGIGYISTVYKGTWRKRIVAIKALATTTPRKLFTHEIEIWKSLNHPNVLELYGASRAPPWFFVSPYCRNGHLVTWLKNGGGGIGGFVLRIKSGENVDESESPRPHKSEWREPVHSRPSLDMWPTPLPGATSEYDHIVNFLLDSH